MGKEIGLVTPRASEKLGSMGLAEIAIRLSKEAIDDWFYSYEVSGQKYFVEQNETGAYTVLLPDEH